MANGSLINNKVANLMANRGLFGVNYIFRRVASRRLVTGLPQKQCYPSILESVCRYR